MLSTRLYAGTRKRLRPNTFFSHFASASEKKIALTNIDGQRSDKLSPDELGSNSNQIYKPTFSS